MPAGVPKAPAEPARDRLRAARLGELPGVGVQEHRGRGGSAGKWGQAEHPGGGTRVHSLPRAHPNTQPDPAGLEAGGYPGTCSIRGHPRAWARHTHTWGGWVRRPACWIHVGPATQPLKTRGIRSWAGTASSGPQSPQEIRRSPVPSLGPPPPLSSRPPVLRRFPPPRGGAVCGLLEDTAQAASFGKVQAGTSIWPALLNTSEGPGKPQSPDENKGFPFLFSSSP